MVLRTMTKLLAVLLSRRPLFAFFIEFLDRNSATRVQLGCHIPLGSVRRSAKKWTDFQRNFKRGMELEVK